MAFMSRICKDNYNTYAPTDSSAQLLFQNVIDYVSWSDGGVQQGKLATLSFCFNTVPYPNSKSPVLTDYVPSNCAVMVPEIIYLLAPLNMQQYLALVAMNDDHYSEMVETLRVSRYNLTVSVDHNFQSSHEDN
jgi:hypothetical protein